MKKLNLISIDDELSARELIKELLADITWVNILGEAENVDDAMDEIIKKQPDAILLDIQMPRRDGFELVEKLIEHKINVQIIFVTAFEKYALRAIKASAFDYLLKPVKKSELVLSLEKLSGKIESDLTERRLSQLMYQLSERKKLKFMNRTGFSMIDPDDIIYCRADSNYTILELSAGKRMTVSMNLGSVEKILPELCFSRISRSVIINLHFLTEVDRKSMTCVLTDGTAHILPFSRKYLHRIEEGCDLHFNINR